jgi:biotin operon repressor
VLGDWGVTPTLTQIHAGSTIGGECRPSQTWDAGRVCAHDGCATVLSIYNKGDFCSAHEAAALDEIPEAPPPPCAETVNDEVLAALRAAPAGQYVQCPAGMKRHRWQDGISRLRKRGYKIKANGAGQYRLLRPGEKLTPQDQLDRRQARRKAERSTETAVGPQAPQEAAVCVSEHVAVNASEVDDELLVMAGLARIAPAARRRVLEWAASRFSDEKESA